jgi:hypothetical protein
VSVEETPFREISHHAEGEENCQIIITTSHKRKTIGAYLEKIGTKHVLNSALSASYRRCRADQVSLAKTRRVATLQGRNIPARRTNRTLSAREIARQH